MVSYIRVQRFCAIALFLLSVLLPGLVAAATNPPGGTLSLSTTTITYTGGPFLVSNRSTESGEIPPVCVADSTCSDFPLTVSIPTDDFNQYRLNVKVQWTNSGTTTMGATNSNFDVFVFSPDITGDQVGAVVSADNPEETSMIVGSGDYTVYVIPFDVSPTVTFTATLTLSRNNPIWPAQQGVTTVPSGTPQFHNFHAPVGVADDAGEPSVGVNWTTEKIFNSIPNGGTVNYFGGFLPYMLRLTFDDSKSPANVTWEQADLLMANLPRAAGDPILFTDHDTGSTFVSQLLGLTPLGSTTDVTKDDGFSFTPSEGSGLPSNIDHETWGGGPYHQPVPTGFNPLYPNAVYYCSQSVAEAGCSLSVDGGTTFLPMTVLYTSQDCGGLHGHVKVAPDGTVYVPNKGCGGGTSDLFYHANGHQAVIVSEDNGTTWSIRQIPTSDTASDRDPSVAIARDGTLYFAYKAYNGHSRVAVSHDKGLTWINDTDVGAQLGIQNSLFQAAVAGDADRAAVAYFGTTKAGRNYDSPDFQGVWYLYVSSTFDGGKTWVTENVTPKDPIQRGGICGSGGCRNLLDFFDATIDKEGRVVIGYEDGCISDACISGTRSYKLAAANDYTAKAVIARQASGKRMFAEFDSMAGNDIHPPTPPTPPPHATSCDGNVVTDPAGDALHPLLTSNGGNTDQVDITKVSFALSTDKTALISTIQLKNFTTTPIAGSLGTFYYAVWTTTKKNTDGTIATRYYATRASSDITGSLSYDFGQYDPGNDSFVGTTTEVTGSATPGPDGTVSVTVPLSLLGNPKIPVTDLVTPAAVIEPYALTIIHEEVLRFTQPADRAPNVGLTGANWAVCPAPTTSCIEDDDASISYSEGWHQFSSTQASGGHFRAHVGNSNVHFASVSLNVPAGQTGKITYYYATSPKGGSAQIYLDGVSKGSVSYAGSQGTTKAPVFGASISFANLAAGQHTLQIKNFTGAVYVDRFCLESAVSNGTPASGPGTTTSSNATLNAGQTASKIVAVAAGTLSISVAAEASNNLPIQLMLIDPAGSILQVADNSSGFAVINAPVSQTGNYIVKTVNVGAGSVQVWTAITPNLQR